MAASRNAASRRTVLQVCPKDIPLTKAIADTGREVMKQAIKDFFRGREPQRTVPDEAAISLIRSCVFWATSPPAGNLFVSNSANT